MRKNTLTKLISILLTTVIAFSFVAAGMPEKAENKSNDVKDEGNVYVMTDPSGKAEKLILTNSVIDALPKASAKGLPAYDNDGNKLECGKLDDQLPLNVKISYTLDGKEISPKKLAGKSGHVVIRYDYENLTAYKANIQGREQEMFVPFAVLTGLLLDNEKFSNISVSSGKVITDGKNSFATGFALPGLQTSLNIGKDLLELPEYVEISADVQDFELSMSLTLVTNNLLEDEGLDFNNTADIRYALSKLTSAVSQLKDGSSALYDGLNTLFGSVGALTDGVNQLADGLTALDANSDALRGGAQQVFNTLLSSANTQIEAAGLGNPGLTMENYNQVLTALIDSLSESNVAQQALEQVTAMVEAKTPEIEAKVTEVVKETVKAKVESAVNVQVQAGIDAQIRQDSEAMGKITAGVTAVVKAQVQEKVAEAFHSEVLNAVLANMGLSLDDYNGMDEENRQKIDAAVGQIMTTKEQEIAAAVAAQMETEETKTIINENVENQISQIVSSKMGEDEVKAKIAAAVEAALPDAMAGAEAQSAIAQGVADTKAQLIAQGMASDEVQAQIVAAAQGREALVGLLDGLNSYAGFYNGLWQYTAGVSAAKTGAETLRSNMPALTDGVSKLKDGASALSDGINRFDRDGISPVVNSLDGEIGALRDRLSASRDAVVDYAPLSIDGMAVNFIYRSGSISK